MQVPGLITVTAIGVGEYHSLAVRGDGTVWAWGQSYFGQLGTGIITTTGCSCQPQPAPVLGVSGATAVAGGNEFSAARTGDGAVWAWGGDSFGEIGDGGVGASNPCGCVATAAQVPGVAGVTAIAAGDYDLYAARTDGALWAWGANFRAQLGNGASDSAAHAPAPVTISRPALTLTPARSLFPDQMVGTTSAPVTITLANGTAAPVAVADIFASGDFAQTNTCGPTLAAGASCTIGITFTPTVVGPRGGVVVVTDNAPDGRHTAAVSGGGSAPGPALNVGATSLAFGAQALNTQSSSQTTTLRNSGTAAAMISGITIDGDFAQTNDCPSSLAAGGSCAITVTFTPTAAGARTGTLRISSDAPGSPLRVGLTGNGVDVPALNLMPTHLTFADQALASQSKIPTVVTVTNTGTGPANLVSITLGGDDGSDFLINEKTCGSTLGSGANCTIIVAFKPGRGAEPVLRADRAAVLSVREATQPTALTAPLSGRAVPPPLMYVHGIKSNADEPSFAAMLDPLRDSLYGGAGFGTRLALFRYYQDKGNVGQDGVCRPGSAALPEYSIPVPIIDDQRVICDSQSDLAVDAVLLYNDMVRLYTENGKQRKVVLVCHSMGCGITRGFLAYAQELHARDATRPSAEDLIDSVIFLEGAISGSMLAKVGGAIDDTRYGSLPVNTSTVVANEVFRFAAKLPPFEFNLTRPAATMLRPDSAYYQWARQEFSPTYAGVRYTPPLPYFTVYGDIRLQEQACLLASCRTIDTTAVGDLVMVPGTPSPYAPAPDGGARFLLDGAYGGQNWEWGMRRDVPYYAVAPLPIAAGTPISLANAIGLVLAAPENHIRFGDTSGEILVGRLP